MEKIRNKKVVLLWLPLLILPLLALVFYLFGGANRLQDTTTASGLDHSLPDAKIKLEDQLDKLGIYELAKKDSSSVTTKLSPIGFNPQAIDQQQQINAKLQAIAQQINTPDLSPKQNLPTVQAKNFQASGLKTDVDRLELLMKDIQGATGEDKELQQLSGLMQDMLDLQYPERMIAKREKIAAFSTPEHAFNAIAVEISGQQTVSTGRVVKIKLADSAVISGISLPQGQLLYGVCQISGQRLFLDIKTIRLANRIIPVDLSVYSLDGIKGIAAPNALIGEAGSLTAEQMVRNIDLIGVEGGMASQAASAGINAAKSIFSKRVKIAKVKLKDHYPLLLRNNKH